MRYLLVQLGWKKRKLLRVSQDNFTAVRRDLERSGYAPSEVFCPPTRKELEEWAVSGVARAVCGCPVKYGIGERCTVCNKVSWVTVCDISPC